MLKKVPVLFSAELQLCIAEKPKADIAKAKPPIPIDTGIGTSQPIMLNSEPFKALKN